MTKFLVFRFFPDAWNLVHMNVDTLEIARELIEHLRQENPKHRFRIIKVIEEVVFEDAKQ